MLPKFFYFSIFLFSFNIFSFFDNSFFFFVEEKKPLQQEFFQSSLVFYHQELEIFDINLSIQKKIFTKFFFYLGFKLQRNDFLAKEILSQLDYSFFWDINFWLHNFSFQIGTEIISTWRDLSFFLFNFSGSYRWNYLELTSGLQIKINSLKQKQENIENTEGQEKKKIDLQHLQQQFFFQFAYISPQESILTEIGFYYRYTFFLHNHFFTYFSLEW